jgi:hypothetical protein
LQGVWHCLILQAGPLIPKSAAHEQPLKLR